MKWTNSWTRETYNSHYAALWMSNHKWILGADTELVGSRFFGQVRIRQNKLLWIQTRSCGDKRELQKFKTTKILSPQYFTKMLCLKSLYFYSKESKLGKSFKTPNIFSIHGLAVASLAAVRGRGSNPASNIRPYGSHTSITT